MRHAGAKVSIHHWQKQRRMNFLELNNKFESTLKNYKFELVELRYVPYALGLEMTAIELKNEFLK